MVNNYLNYIASRSSWINYSFARVFRLLLGCNIYEPKKQTKVKIAEPIFVHGQHKNSHR